MREKEVKIKKEKAFSSNSSSSVAVQLTHGCVDLIEQGTICKERERERVLGREREREEKRSSERRKQKKRTGGRERANCLLRGRVNARPGICLFSPSFSFYLFTLKQNILNSSDVGSRSGCSGIFCCWCCCWWRCCWCECGREDGE